MARLPGQKTFKPSWKQYQAMLKAYVDEPSYAAVTRVTGINVKHVKKSFELGWLECGPKFVPIRELLADDERKVAAARKDTVDAMLALHEAARQDRIEVMKQEAITVQVLRASALRTGLTLHETVTALVEVSPAIHATILSLVEGGKVPLAALQALMEAQVNMTTGLVRLTDSVQKLMSMEADIFDRERRESDAAAAGKADKVSPDVLHANMLGSVTNIQDAYKRRKGAA